MSAQDEKSPSATSVGGSELPGDGSSPPASPGAATREIEGTTSVRKIPRGLSPLALLYEAHAARKGVSKEVQVASPPSMDLLTPISPDKQADHEPEGESKGETVNPIPSSASGLNGQGETPFAIHPDADGNPAGTSLSPVGGTSTAAQCGSGSAEGVSPEVAREEPDLGGTLGPSWSDRPTTSQTTLHQTTSPHHPLSLSPQERTGPSGASGAGPSAPRPRRRPPACSGRRREPGRL